MDKPTMTLLSMTEILKRAQLEHQECLLRWERKAHRHPMFRRVNIYHPIEAHYPPKWW